MPISKPAEEFHLAESVVVCWKEGGECVWHPDLERLNTHKNRLFKEELDLTTIQRASRGTKLSSISQGKVKKQQIILTVLYLALQFVWKQ